MHVNAVQKECFNTLYNQNVRIDTNFKIINVWKTY